MLQSFIDKGLWDEARLETAPFCLGEGVSAPILKDEQLESKQNYGGQIIQQYRHKQWKTWNKVLHKAHYSLIKLKTKAELNKNL